MKTKRRVALLSMAICVIILSSCTSRRKINTRIQDTAVKYAITFLSNSYDYDKNKDYKLHGPYYQMDIEYPVAYELLENNTRIVTVYVYDMNELYSDGDREKENYFAFPYVFEKQSVLSEEWIYGNKDIKLNEKMTLESVETVEITEETRTTPETVYDLIKQSCYGNVDFITEKWDLITVYDYVKTYNIEINEETKTINVTPEGRRKYPVAIDGQIRMLVDFSDDFTPLGAWFMENENEPAYLSLIYDKTAFIVVNNWQPYYFANSAVITADLDDCYFDKVIVDPEGISTYINTNEYPTADCMTLVFRKSLNQLMELAHRSQPIEILFEFKQGQ